MKYTRNTENKNPKVVRTKNGRIMLLSKCAVYLNQPGFTYSACEPFAKKKKERTKKFKDSGDLRYIYTNELDKACFEHDIAYGYFKDLTRITASEKILREKPFNIVENPRYHGYQCGLASMIYKFFDKKNFW